MKRYEWYEVWADESPGSPYLLILFKTEDVYQIVDPQDGHRLVLESGKLQDARNFLLEDEYERVEGRVHDVDPLRSDKV